MRVERKTGGERGERRGKKSIKRLVCLENRARLLFFNVLISPMKTILLPQNFLLYHTYFCVYLGLFKLSLKGCMQKFCKGEGGGTWSILKKAASNIREALADNVKN